MRVYQVSGMTCGGCEQAITRAIKKKLGSDTAVDANASRGEVRVSEPADSQIITFAIEGAGYPVHEVSDDMGSGPPGEK